MLASPIPELYMQKRIAKPNSKQQRINEEELSKHGALAVLTVSGNSLQAMREMAASCTFKGSILWSESMEKAAEHGRHPLYEICWNHTTLHAMRNSKRNEELTYLQTGFAPGENLLEEIQAVHDFYNGNAVNENEVGKTGQVESGPIKNELMTHLEFVNLGGKVGAFGIPVMRFTTEKRLHEVIDELEKKFGIGVFNPHTYVLEDGGMKQTDEQQLAFKRLVDPTGLMNPGT